MTPRFGIVSLLILMLSGASWASSGEGSEGASFLDIPVGAAPAALGSAYTARATDAYAPVWNPAGLALADAPRLSATHLAYLAGIHYEYVGAAVPMKPGIGLGASVQYLGSGDLIAADEQGNITGSFSTSFAAYSLAYGQTLTPKLSLGITGKAITESIADASAHGFAGDIGMIYKWNDKLSLGAVAANLGPDIKFVQEGDPLPTMIRGGANAHLFTNIDTSAELVYRRTGLVSFRTGVEAKYLDFLVLRMGLDTDHTHGLSGVAVFTGGLGIHAMGQEFAYAWVPYGDLGSTHYFSIDFRFGGKPEATAQPGLIKVDEDEPGERPTHATSAGAAATAAPSSDYDLLEQVLTDTEKRSMDKNKTPPAPEKEQP